MEIKYISNTADNTAGRKKRTTSVFTAMLLLAIASFFIISPLVMNAYMNYYTKNCTAEAEGVVVRYNTKVSTDDDHMTETYYAPVVSFTAEDGKTYVSAYKSYNTFMICDVGDSIRLFYDPDKPDRITLPDLETDRTLSDVIFMLPGFILMIPAIIALIKAKKQKNAANAFSEP